MNTLVFRPAVARRVCRLLTCRGRVHPHYSVVQRARALATISKLNLDRNTSHKTLNLVQRAVDYARVLNDEKSTVQQVEAFWHPRIAHTEFPNQMQLTGRQRGIGELRAQFATAKKVLSGQIFEIESVFTQGSDEKSIVMELSWAATLAVPLRDFEIGDQIRASIAAFMEFDDDGRITKQRNYVNYHPRDV